MNWSLDGSRLHISFQTLIRDHSRFNYLFLYKQAQQSGCAGHDLFEQMTCIEPNSITCTHNNWCCGDDGDKVSQKAQGFTLQARQSRGKTGVQLRLITAASRRSSGLSRPIRRHEASGSRAAPPTPPGVRGANEAPQQISVRYVTTVSLLFARRELRLHGSPRSASLN